MLQVRAVAQEFVLEMSLVTRFLRGSNSEEISHAGEAHVNCWRQRVTQAVPVRDLLRPSAVLAHGLEVTRRGQLTSRLDLTHYVSHVTLRG